jgi:hypothetical protein
MSDIQPKAIDEASAEERRAYATTFLNLDLVGTESDDDILAKIRAAQPGLATIFVQIEPEPVPETELLPEEQAGRMAGSLGRGDPRAVIFIPNVETDDNTGSADIYVGVNGKGWQLKRGVDLPVPWRVVEALGLTLQDIIRHDDEGNVIKTAAMRFPVQVMKRPTDEQIAEWHKRTDDQFCP